MALNDNFFLGYINHVNNATLSGPGWSNIDRLKQPDLWSISRNTGNTATLNIDIGAAKQIQAFSLHAHNLSETASITVKAGSTAGADDLGTVTKPAYSTAFDDFLPFSNLDFIAEINAIAQHWSIEITNTAPIEIGRAGVWTGITPEVGPNWGAGHGVEDFSVSARSLGADLLTAKRPRKRTISFALGWIINDERKKFLSLMQTAGHIGEVLVVTDDQLSSFVGTCQQTPTFRRRHFNANEIEFEVIER